MTASPAIPGAPAQRKRRHVWSAPLTAAGARLSIQEFAGWVREACQSRFPRERGFSCRAITLPREDGGVRLEIRGDHLAGVILVVPAQGRGGYRELDGVSAQVRIIAEALVPEPEQRPASSILSDARSRRAPLASQQLHRAGVLFTAVMIELAACAAAWFFLMTALAWLELLPLETALSLAARAALWTCLGLAVGAPLWERALARRRPLPPGARAAGAWEGVCRELEQLCRSLRADRLPAVARVAPAPALT